jgi:hypothetical protein
MNRLEDFLLPPNLIERKEGFDQEIDAIVEIAHKHNVLVIEDCAHTLSSSYKGKLLGTWGDAAFFSFGRDKVVSSVFGGAAIIADRHVEAAETLQKNHDALPYPSFFWIMQQLFHPIAFALILPLYTSGIGKVLLFLFQRLKFLSFPVYPVEKKGENPGMFPQKYPNALSVLVYHQWQKLR